MLGFRLICVDGDSMGEDLPDGSYALFGCRGNAGPGDIVLAQHSKYGMIVKELVAISKHSFRLKGRSPASVSEAQIGTLPRDALIGRLLCSNVPASTT